MYKNCVNFLLMIVSIVISLVLVEFGFRFSSLIEYDQVLRTFNHELYVVDRTKDYVLKMRPNIRIIHKTFKESASYWKCKINSYGFRGEPFDLNSDSFRILFLGDSYTFGWGINDKDVHPRKVEEIIEGRYKKDVSIFNLGVPGYSSITEEALLRDWIHVLKPDLVILEYVMNDAEPQNNVLPNPKLIYQNKLFWMFEYLSNRDGKPNYLDGFKLKSWKWKASKGAIRNINTLCKERNVPLIIFIFPDMGEKFGKLYKLKPIHDVVSEWGAEFDVPTYDLLPYFDGKNNKEYSIYLDGHPNVKANKLFAEIIVEKIIPFIKERPK